MELKAYVLSHVLAETYYAARFKGWNPKARTNVLCPWHDDTKPSLSICLANGGAKCHACGKSIGNIVHFESEANQISEGDAGSKIYAEFVRPVIDAGEYASLQKAYSSNAKINKAVEKECGISGATAKTLSLGWDKFQNRITFPVYDRFGQIVNLRCYKLPSMRRPAEEGMKVINRKGFGGNDLYPWELFKDYSLDQPIFVMPSEKELALGIQFGLQCVCATAGEMAWEEDWSELFTGYDIAIVAQRDKTGRAAAAKKLAILQKVANRCAVIEPPTQHKDFADYVVLDGGQGLGLLAEFSKAIANMGGATELATSQVQTSATTKSPVSFSESTVPENPRKFSEDVLPLAVIGSRPEMLNTVVRTQGIVAAKATITYTIPWKFKVRTGSEAQKYYSVGMGRVLLSFVKASDIDIIEMVRVILGKKNAEIEPCDYITATEVEVIPVVAMESDSVYVTQRCFYLGARIEANVPYSLEVIPTNAVKSQETVGLIVSAVPISRAMETRTFTDEEFASLQIFQPQGEETVFDKLLGIAEELSQHQTKIYNRPDWHIAALLTWLSPIGFAFPYEKETQRGWLNTLVVGDTETGKSKVVKSYQRLFNAGTVVNAENCTYVGLVGGAVKMGSGQFMLRWGRIPLCDRQLVVIEELSGLSVEEISNLSDVRSSGTARLDKGGLSAETHARTRLLCLSNVRPVNKTLAGYLSGIQAIRELIGHGEDIARFDLICTLIDREVSVEVINRPFNNRGKGEAIADELWQRLCQFVWSLKPDQIKISPDAYYAILEKTKDLSSRYHSAVPIFKGGSGRYKIARIAIAIAALQFSFNGKRLLVHEDHIDAACRYLEMLYEKPSLGYREWSDQMFDRDSIKSAQLLDEDLETKIPNGLKRAQVVESLIHTSKFTRDELCAVAGLQIMQADSLIGTMVRERVLRKGDANVWEITPAGRDWMQTHLNDNNENNNNQDTKVRPRGHSPRNGSSAR